jgi:5'-nucleotidase
MPIDLSRQLVIGVSSRALFDMTEANEVFEKKGLEAYTRYQMKHQAEPLEPGTGFPLIKSILELRRRASRPRAEVIITSHNSPAASLRMFNSIKHYGLDIRRAALTGGANLAPYIEAFSVDLFLSAYEEDVRDALAAKVAAGLIYDKPADLTQSFDQIRIAFDGDAVIFSDESERVFQEQGLAAFCKHEESKSRLPLPEGPFAELLKALSIMQSDPALKPSPIRLALVTARGMPAHERVIRTLISWKVRIDEAFFMDGADKTRILQAFRPHIFFDDQRTHCERAAPSVPTAQVLCPTPAVACTARKGSQRSRRPGGGGLGARHSQS